MPDERWTFAPGDHVPDEIPPFLRQPPAGTVQAGQFWLSSIDAKLRKLEALGLHPHAAVLEHKAVMERWARGEGVGEPFPETMKRDGWF